MDADVVDVFRHRREGNHFDRLTVPVADLYERFPVGRAAEWPVAPARPGFETLYRSAWLPIALRQRAWQLLRRLRLDQRWFDEFAVYWTAVLGGRHLFGVEDFHFLRGVYRMRHQDNQVPDTDDPARHLEAWQQPELIYQLFQQVMVESINPQPAICAAIRSHLRRDVETFLEFGAASAPIVTSYLEFFGPAPRTTFYVSDIQTLSFHYAAFKSRGRRNVVPRLLTAENRFTPVLDRELDVICCMQVFEHLQEPARIAAQLADALRPGGLLVFDYVLGDGAGLDTRQGVQQRAAVLDGIAARFDIAEGRLTVDRTITRAIARKR